MNEINDLGLRIYLAYENPKYPVLVIQGERFSIGYDLDQETGELKRTCICHAKDEFECVCGGFEIEEINDGC